ncbi:DUF4230 domain-containing protein [Geminocystis sp. NIES-3709]|uniref:DUF4230 domain-containing protein n=1 Tax=Geminocystis sp. NIES-3709 TaxID=1617448 RepID=UPI0005FCA82E|nr:DUF4230 domain-containing protein [Geminocystis sp. NIES-3709]BAQ63837.1 hypothetical protein GM3709_602 [Geminocystis sp. NIES-3709]
MNTSKPFILNPHLFKIFFFLSGSGFTLVILLGLFGIWKTGTDFIQGITHLFHHEVTLPTTKNPHVILRQVQGVSELTTSIFVMDTIVPTSSNRKIGNWVVGETNLLYVARGEVKAGLDLSNLTAEDIVIQGDNIKIELPPVKILDEKIDLNQSQVYNYDRGFLNLGPDVALDLQLKAQQETLTKIKETACQQKILNQANDKAVILITELMKNSGFATVEVTTTPSNDCK